MAPEIVRGEAAPNAQTDLFSLAVLLFYMFVNHHPLEGEQEAQIRALDLPAMNRCMEKTQSLFLTPTTIAIGLVPVTKTMLLICGRSIRSLFRRSSFEHLPTGCTIPTTDDGKSVARRIGPTERFYLLLPTMRQPKLPRSGRISQT